MIQDTHNLKLSMQKSILCLQQFYKLYFYFSFFWLRKMDGLKIPFGINKSVRII